jgi:zinc transport system ATP-binding protein
MLVETGTVLAAEGLTVELGGLPVLRGVGIAVRAGEAVALLGGNGSGKSTLVRTVLGLLPHQRGTVRLFGSPLRDFRDWSRIGYVPQRRLFRALPRADRDAVRTAITLVGLAEQRNADIAELSGGQQQRALIARALAGEPDLLVLDEPISGVDLEHQRVLADVLAGLLSAGTSALVVLHDVGPLGSLLDRAVVLSDGRVVHDGALGDLGQHRRRLGGHEYLDHGPAAAPDHDDRERLLGGAVEP